MGYNSKNRRKNYIIKRTSTERFMLLAPIYFIVAIVPLVARLYIYDPKLSEYSFFSMSTTNLDVFLYWKQWLFVGAFIVLLIIIASKAYKDKTALKFSKVYLPLGIYALLALLSTLFSKYSSFGFSGIMDQFENVWCLIGYMLLPYYIYLYVEDEQDVKAIIAALSIGAALLSAIGLSQAFGHDFWFSKVGYNIMDPKEYGLSLSLEPKRAYISNFNPNYVGTYVGLMLPVFLVLLLCSKKIKDIIVYVLLVSALAIVLLSSKADSGIIGITISLLFVVIFLRRVLLKRWYAVIAAIIIAAGAIFAAGTISEIDYFKNAYDDVKKGLTVEKRVSTPKLYDIITEDVLTIIYNDNTLIFKASDNLDNLWLQFYDGDGKIVDYVSSDNNSFYFEDERYKDITMALEFVDSDYGIYVHYKFYMEGKSWVFTNMIDENGFYYLNSFYRYTKIESQHTNIFKGYEHIMSNRGFLWAHTIPLLKDNIILGSGADSFILAYPQYDYVNMRNHGYGDVSLISKPHNLYLQVGVQTGVLSLISLLVFFAIYFIWGIKLYINNRFETLLPQAGVAILIGTVSYLAIGIVNDSSITTAPTFWTLIGLGTAINFLVHKQIKEQKPRNEMLLAGDKNLTSDRGTNNDQKSVKKNAAPENIKPVNGPNSAKDKHLSEGKNSSEGIYPAKENELNNVNNQSNDKKSTKRISKGKKK